MKTTFWLVGIAAFFIFGAAHRTSLFDGHSFAGWEGDTIHTWKIKDGALVGGSLADSVRHNDFIATTRAYTNYILTLSFKLEGTEGFINSGVQFHSRRTTDPPYEMTGYQADLGDGYWGSLYDESRRNKKMADADPAVIKKYLKPNDWNTYEVYCLKGRIRIRLNGAQTLDYTELADSIPQTGLIALQVHGGGKTRVSFKNILIEELP